MSNLFPHSTHLHHGCVLKYIFCSTHYLLVICETGRGSLKEASPEFIIRLLFLVYCQRTQKKKDKIHDIITGRNGLSF